MFGYATIRVLSGAGTVPALLGGRSWLVFGLVAALVVAVALARRLGGPNGDTDDADADDSEDDADSNSVWDAIPSWQYAGRHVESGGLTRDEQETALREIQVQAAEIERREALESTEEDVDR